MSTWIRHAIEPKGFAVLAAVGGLSADATIQVRRALAFLRIEPDSPELTVGQSIALSAVGTDEEGGPVDVNPTWSAGPQCRLNTTTGRTVAVTGLELDSCVVSCREGDVQAETTITILPAE